MTKLHVLSLTILAVVCALVLLPSSNAMKRPHENSPASVPALSLTEPCAEDVELSTCPLAGCGELGDALLNKAKNRSDVATHPVHMTLNEIKQLDQPNRWDTGTSRASIQGANKEGTPVWTTGYLLKAKKEGAESCNCGLTRRVDTDVHLVIVNKMPDVDDEDEFDEAERNSVTAELTPRVRAKGHSNWIYKEALDLEGYYVRLGGFLMLDTKHIPQDHRLPHERANKGLKRATNWEIHPVTNFQYCTKSKNACDHNIGWVNF